MIDQVTCRSDSQYPERPTSFFHDGERWTVKQILARWRTPHNRHFRVLTWDERVFELIYHEAEDHWVIEPA